MKAFFLAIVLFSQVTAPEARDVAAPAITTEYRTWTSSTGSTCEACLKEIVSRTIVLERKEGEPLFLLMEDLSKADQQAVLRETNRRMRERIRDAKARREQRMAEALRHRAEIAGKIDRSDEARKKRVGGEHLSGSNWRALYYRGSGKL